MQPLSERDAGRIGTRGVILLPSDLTWKAWPRRGAEAGLTTISLHDAHSINAVVSYIKSEEGQAFLAECRERGLEVEYELHAMAELLPRELFDRDPSMFRMDEDGRRLPDANLCAHSEAALEIAEENAAALADHLRPTTGRYFLWGDDGAPGCLCPRCRGLSFSDQALLLEGRLLAAVRRSDPGATLAHLAYAMTLDAPTQVRPEPGIFLEFAPIGRRYDLPLTDPSDPEQRRHIEALDANLELFGAAGAQALEYWLDASKLSGWKRPAAKLPFREGLLAEDIAACRSRGIRHITSFAAYIDADYVARHGEPPLAAYGEQPLGAGRS